MVEGDGDNERTKTATGEGGAVRERTARELMTFEAVVD